MKKKFLSKLQGWLWAPKGFPYDKNCNAGLLQGDLSKIIKDEFNSKRNYKVLNLNLKDGYEPFLLIITPNFQCILTIAGEKDKKTLLMRSDEESLKNVIELINMKLNQENYEEGLLFRNSINNLGELNINDGFEKNFWPSLSAKLAQAVPNFNIQNFVKNDDKTVQITEAKLLKAISHEV